MAKKETDLFFEEKIARPHFYGVRHEILGNWNDIAWRG